MFHDKRPVRALRAVAEEPPRLAGKRKQENPYADCKKMLQAVKRHGGRKLYSVTACQDGSQTGSVGYRPNKRHFLALAGEDTSVQGRLRLPLSPNTSSLANRAQVVIEVVKAFASSEDTS